MKKTVNVVVGTPIYRQGAFIIDKFLSNQKEIQQSYPSSELVLATVEDDFADELEKLISFWELNGKVIRYQTTKPDYARSKLWNVACGRETIRQYTLLQTEASYLLFLDADMTFDPNVIEVMEREIEGYDALYSGYAQRDFGISLTGLGCTMITRDTLEKIRFRCREFKNGEVIPEDELFAIDVMGLGSRIKRGFFLATSHYKSENEAGCIGPHPLGVLRKITTSRFVRYGLIRANIMARHDVTGRLEFLLYRLLATIRRVPPPRRGCNKAG